MFKLRISSADKLFSQLIRRRAKWNCERCYTHYEPPTMALQCSHFYGRGNMSVRFDPENAAALCHGCHQYVAAHPIEHREFFLKRLGENKLNALTLRAHTAAKVDERMIAMGLRAQLKAMDGEIFGAR